MADPVNTDTTRWSVANPPASPAPVPSPAPAAPSAPEPPAPEPPVAAAPEPPPAPPAKPHTLATDLPPEALKPRLDAAKATGKAELLKELGFATPEEAKAAADELKAKREAAKTAEEKHAEALAAAKAAQARVAELEATVRANAETQLATLTQDQQDAVKEVAGDDPAKIVKAIAAFAKTWSVPVTATAPAAPAPAPAAPKPAGNTAPIPSAPPQGGTTPAPDIRAVVEEVRKTNPFKAARIIVQNQATFGKPPSA